MGEAVPEELDWKLRSTNDSEFASARFKCFDVLVQDCDGDFSRWEIRRGKQYLAMGECGGIKPYHMDAAMKLARDVLVPLWRAVEMNDFVANELPKFDARAGVSAPAAVSRPAPPHPRVTDNDRDEVTVTLDGRELRSWSYSSDAQRRVRMLCAREFVEGFCTGAERKQA